MPRIQIKRELWFWGIILLPFLYYFLVRVHLASRIPTHFDLQGKPNGYMPPGAFLEFLLVLNGGSYLLLLLLPRIDPRRANYNLFRSTYFMIRFIICLLLSTLGILTLMMGTGLKIDMNRILLLLLMTFFLILGNFLGKVRPNWFVGIRTPWTLSSERVWRQTHQISGRLLFFSSLFGFLLALWMKKPSITLLIPAVLGIGLILPACYSYFLFRKYESGNGTNNSENKQDHEQ